MATKEELIKLIEAIDDIDDCARMGEIYPNGAMKTIVKFIKNQPEFPELDIDHKHHVLWLEDSLNAECVE